MTTLVSLVETPGTESRLTVVSHAIGSVLDLPVVTRYVDPACSADELMSELERAKVGGVVLAAGEEPTSLWWSLAPRLPAPVVVLPAAARDPSATVRHALVPLDGSRAATTRVSDIVKRLEAHDVSVRLLHVFDATTVPRFWDQAAHAGRHWETEFRERHRLHDRDLVLRRGSGPGQVVAEADRSGVDLIVLGWNGRLAGRSAAVVRRAVLRGTVPVMLLNPAASRRVQGPRAR